MYTVKASWSFTHPVELETNLQRLSPSCDSDKINVQQYETHAAAELTERLRLAHWRQKTQSFH